MKEITNLINIQTFLVQDIEMGELVTTCMDVYTAKIQSDRSIDKLKLSTMARRDLQNK